jgi:hypothetical protein
MLQSSNNNPPESLSQLSIKICSVRLPSSSKLVDICVIMEVDNKYTYRTEIIRKAGKSNPTTNPIIIINETLDTLVTSNSKINLKIHAPTRIFGNNDLGHIEFNLKSIIDDYYLKQENTTNNNDISPSYRLQLPFQNSTTSSSSLFRSNDNNNNNSATGMIEVIFYGSLLKQQQQQQNEMIRTSIESVNTHPSVETQTSSNEPISPSRQNLSPNQTNGTPTSDRNSPIDETRLAQLRQQVRVKLHFFHFFFSFNFSYQLAGKFD